MVAESNSLTGLKVARISKPGRYGDGGGLYLRVAEYRLKDGTLARSKNWLFRFERDGRERQMGLGSLNTLSLADARAKARDCRKALLDGTDPIEARLVRRQKSKLDHDHIQGMCRALYQPPTARAGRTRYTPSNGRQRWPGTFIRLLAHCRWRRSTPRW
jgi:Arm domain-containing DNA-binding protein